MPIVSGLFVPQMNPASHVGNIRLLRPVVVAVLHQEDFKLRMALPTMGLFNENDNDNDNRAALG